MGKENRRKQMELRRKKRLWKQGGSKEAVERQHAQGKLTARERLDLLFDKGTFVEYGTFAIPGSSLHGIDKQFAPGDGVVTGFGKVDGRLVWAVSQDFTVLGGSMGQHHSRKICRASEEAARNGCPCVYFWDGGGGRLQEAWFEFYLCGPEVIWAATGEAVSKEELAGAYTENFISDNAHQWAVNDKDAIWHVKRYLSYMPQNCREKTQLVPYVDDVSQVIRLLADKESVYEYQPYWAQNLVTCFGRIMGETVGFIANQPKVKAGCFDIDASDKFTQTGFYRLSQPGGWMSLVMITIAFGMLCTNLLGADMFHEVLFAGGHVQWGVLHGDPVTAQWLAEMADVGVAEAVLRPLAEGDVITAGLLDYLYLGVKLGIYPCLIFMGVGAMTDFGPLIANPKSLLLGAAAQFGIFMTFVGTRLMGFSSTQASSIGIIGGADGPTAIFVTSHLAPDLLGPIAVAAYSYMALVPVIQPPIMITVFVALLVPSAAPLVASLMLGNLVKGSGVADRLCKTMSNELMNIVTIFLGFTVGATATSTTFLSIRTIEIMLMGVVAFGFGTAGGLMLAKLMNRFLKEKIDPLIGSAGVSAVPMAARVSQVEGQKEDPGNFLLMHAMGPNVAVVIGSAIAAGVLMALFG